jgi:hypothetical protein
MTGPDDGGWRAAGSAPPLRAGQVLQFHFGAFSPRITIRSERELTVDVIEGDSRGFSDTVEYQAVTVRDGLIMLSWREHNGSTIVHALDLNARTTYAAVTPADDGGFMRMIGQIDIKSGS